MLTGRTRVKLTVNKAGSYVKNRGEAVREKKEVVGSGDYTQRYGSGRADTEVGSDFCSLADGF